MNSTPTERLQHAADTYRDDFDGTAEPMRAIRDLITACESVFGCDNGEDHLLRRAQDAFTELRKLFGDDRPAEDIEAARMIEPKDLRTALQLTAAALQSTATATDREDARIRFTGKWAHLGTMTVSAILDRANEALAVS